MRSKKGAGVLATRRFGAFAALALLVAIAACLALVGCGGAGDVDNADSADSARLQHEQGEGDSTARHGTQEAYTMQELSFSRDGKRIVGELFCPNSVGPHPTVVLAHGFGGNMSYVWEYAQRFAENGFAAYAFDFVGGGINSKSDGEMTEMSVLTEAADMDAVIAGLRALDTVDNDRLFLFGESQGGFEATYAASRHSSEVRGLIAFYPAYVLQDDARQRVRDGDAGQEGATVFGMEVGSIYTTDALSFDIYEAMQGYEGPTLIVHGTADYVVPLFYSQRAQQTMKNAELVTLEGAGHGFNGADRERAAQLAVDFAKRNL